MASLMTMEKARKKILDMITYLKPLSKTDEHEYRNANVMAKLKWAEKESKEFEDVDKVFFSKIKNFVEVIRSQIKSKDYPNKNRNVVRRNVKNLYKYVVGKLDNIKNKGDPIYQA